MTKETKPKNVQKKAAINTKAMDWSYDQFAKAKLWNKRLLILLIFSFISIVCLALTITLMMPLKEQIPVFVRVNDATGSIDVMTELDDMIMTKDEALDEAFVIKYIRAREGYLYHTFANQYETIMAMSNNAVGANYSTIVNDNSNPDNPFVKYSNEVEVVIRINSITNTVARTSNNSGVSVIRITVTENAKSTTTRSSKSYDKIITMQYKYTPAKLTRDRRWINPLGFVTTSYISEDEL